MCDVRSLIVQADRIAKEQGLTQAEWSRQAGLDYSGVTLSRTYKRGNCKLSTLVTMLKPLGYTLKIAKED